tara:strand:+ start:564 stop:1316 length:753 start_codon:yes stop_codon:yes gene_type:complete
MEICPPSNELKRGEIKRYYLNDNIRSDSDDSDEEDDAIIKKFYDNYNKMKDYCEGLEGNEENIKLFYGDLESLNDAHDTYISHTLDTKLIVGLPWTQEQLNGEEGQNDGDIQMQYKIWKLSRKFCNYCAKFKLEKAKECHIKLLDLRRAFLDFASNQNGLVRSTNVRSKVFNSENSCKKYRANECDVTLLPAGEVHRLLANSMKRHYDCEIEIYKSAYDFRKQFSVYNEYMMDKHPSILGSHLADPVPIS